MKKLLIFLLALSISSTFGQNILTIEQAIEIALKNNYDIRVQQNETNINRINNTAGNAGMLPSVSLNGTANYTGNNLYQKKPDNTSTETPNAHSDALAGGIELTWTLFDGGKMFATKARLNEIESMGEIQFKDKVQQTLYDVLLAYYDIVRQKQELNSINEVILYNQERVKISETGFNAGLAPKTNWLQAQIDLNVFRENKITQEYLILSAKRTLNLLLARDPDLVYDVTDTIPVNWFPDKNDLLSKLYQLNTTLQINQKEINIAKWSLKEINSLRLPNLNVSTSYGLSVNNFNYGTYSVNRTFGPQFGGIISIPLFQAGNIRTRAQTAKLQLLIAQYNYENNKLYISTQLQNALTEYDNQLKLLEIEKSNVVLAKENLLISLERLRLGQTTSLEVSQAQNSYVESRTRLINFEYNLKVAESRLKMLIGSL